MQMAALTFRAEPDFIDAVRAYAEGLGVSVNRALRDMIAPIVGYAHKTRQTDRPRNDLARFCGMLKGVDCRKLEAAQEDFSKIDENMGCTDSAE